MQVSSIEIQLDTALAQLVQGKFRRAIFVANNPDVNEAAFDRLKIDESDIVIQFNKSIFYQAIKKIKCLKVHVFNFNKDEDWWGFSNNKSIDERYLQQSSSGIILIFTRWMAEYIKNYLTENSCLVRGTILNPDWRPLHYGYTPDKFPSAGFEILNLFRDINTIRYFCNEPTIQLVEIGFSGIYPPTTWSGHDFAFEQKVYATWLDLKRLKPDGGE
jgi:hypothetical protein